MTVIAERPTEARTPVPEPFAEALRDDAVVPKDLLIIDYSGDLEKVWASMILASTAIEMGVEFIPCQMTMDMFGLKPDDMIEGMAEPVGAATVIGLLSENSVPLFI